MVLWWQSEGVVLYTVTDEEQAKIQCLKQGYIAQYERVTEHLEHITYSILIDGNIIHILYEYMGSLNVLK